MQPAVADDDDAPAATDEGVASDVASDDAPSITPAPQEESTVAETTLDAPLGADTSDDSAAVLDVAAPTGLRVRVQPSSDAPASLGSIDPAWGATSQPLMRVDFTLAGAGVDAIKLANHFVDAVSYQEARRGNPRPEDHFAIQKGAAQTNVAVFPLAALAVEIQTSADGPVVEIPLFSSAGKPVWREKGPGEFVAEIEDGAGELVARINRRYRLPDDTYQLRVTQTFENLSGAEMFIRWSQYGPADIIEEKQTGYRLPSDRVRVGYLPTLGTEVEPGPRSRLSGATWMERGTAFKEIPYVQNQQGNLTGSITLWDTTGGVVAGPPSGSYPEADRISWVAQSNRYFAFVIHPLLDPQKASNASRSDLTFRLAQRVNVLEFGAPGLDNEGRQDNNRLLTELLSERIEVGEGTSADLSFGVYAGPVSKQILAGAQRNPVLDALDLDALRVYQIGMCGICTFQWLAQGLLWLLGFFHMIVSDWAIAIIILVICVRAILHPITKKSQVSMMRFGKQMQRVAPKQKKIQERYKNDPQKMREEMMRLMREERVNPAGALGCLPMLLQSPIWIALYAMVYFAFPLRHEPAFYGLFQSLTGGSWTFLNDLASPDHFYEWGGNFQIPLIGGLMGPITGLNILPLLMGVVFFIQQKYLTPPTSATLSPEQQQTQKIMKVMLVVMMPVFLYNAPAGLTLYIMTSSTLGILESRYIRSHVDKMDLESPPKPRMSPNAGAGRKKVANQAQPFGKKGRVEPPRRFKSRDKK